jgi:hypothetical protein
MGSAGFGFVFGVGVVSVWVGCSYCGCSYCGCSHCTPTSSFEFSIAAVIRPTKRFTTTNAATKM